MPSSANQSTVDLGSPLESRDSGVFQTSPGLLRRRALGPWAEAIQQYLAIRLGDPVRSRGCYRSFKRMVEALPPDELLASPGLRAQLYHRARSVAQAELTMPGGARGGTLGWRSREKGHARLRTELPPSDAELLELRHARELALEEIAFVVELPLDAAELALDTAEARARRILGGGAPDPSKGHASVYVEAFALARSWQEAQTLPPSSVSDAEPGLEDGTLVGGRYEVVQRVGSGAFGDVYRAEDIEVPGHQVALKMIRQPALSESARQYALRELKLNAAVFHPSLVQFKDHGWFEQRLWFVMPWYQGETLDARMRRGGLSRAEARTIFEPLARALAALHAAGIRHQDIKPENVLLTDLPGEETPLPVLIDLGVAAEEQETMLGGTPLYFAPEVAARFVAKGRGGPSVGGAADVFALALSLRNALEPGTRADVAAGAVNAFVERRAKEVPDLPEARDLRYLGPTWERWLSLDALERPSAGEFAEELAILTLPEERRERRVRLLRWLAPLLLTLAVIFVAGFYVMDRRVVRGEHRAREARMAAADARADLIVADARQAALEEGHATLLESFEQSRMSRRELAMELATTQGQLAIVGDELAGSLRQASQLEVRVERVGQVLAERDTALASATSERDEARRDVERTERERELARALAEEESRAREIALTRVAALSRSLAGANARSDSLSQELGEARRVREESQAELVRLQARIQELATTLLPDPTDPETSAEPSLTADDEASDQ